VNYFPVSNKVVPHCSDRSIFIDEFKKTVGVISKFHNQQFDIENKSLTNVEIIPLQSLSFFVEATWQMYPKTWTDELSSLRNRLDDISKKHGETNYEAKKEATWLVCQTISTLWALSLDETCDFVADLKDEKLIDSNKIEKQKFLNFKRLMAIFHKGAPVTYPPIPEASLPDWFSVLGIQENSGF